PLWRTRRFLGWTFLGIRVKQSLLINHLPVMTMKIGFQMICLAGLATALLSASAADPTVPTPAPATAAPVTRPVPDRSKISYSIGVNIGRNIKAGSYDVDLDEMQAAIKDVLGGKDLKLTDEQMREAMSSYQQEVRAKREEERKKMLEKNHKEA